MIKLKASTFADNVLACWMGKTIGSPLDVPANAYVDICAPCLARKEACVCT